MTEKNSENFFAVFFCYKNIFLGGISGIKWYYADIIGFIKILSGIIMVLRWYYSGIIDKLLINSLKLLKLQFSFPNFVV